MISNYIKQTVAITMIRQSYYLYQYMALYRRGIADLMGWVHACIGRTSFLLLLKVMFLDVKNSFSFCNYWNFGSGIVANELKGLNYVSSIQKAG